MSLQDNDTCLSVTARGDVFSWGADQHGHCGRGSTDTRHTQRTPRYVHALVGVHAHSASAGFSHSLIVTEEGTMYAFSEGNTCRLGHGTTATNRRWSMAPRKYQHHNRMWRTVARTHGRWRRFRMGRQRIWSARHRAHATATRADQTVRHNPAH